jgi:glycosyltransferase involved in cell wall biosynthesis
VRLAVVVASIGRGEEIGQLLENLSRQSVQPCAIVLSVERESDLPESFGPDIQIVMGPRGLTAQRNRGMEKLLGQSDIIVFFDDDFLPAEHAIADIIAFFEQNPEVIGATGNVLRDGVKQGGLSYADAVQTLGNYRPQLPVLTSDSETLYGCNMAFRTAAIGQSRFDEKLPLYAWQEDVDFAGQMRRKGRIVSTSAFAGVHRGVNKGRTPGLALGYSQIINPAYLVAKGTMSVPKAARLMVKNIIANHVKRFRPEPFIDRAGRARGNWRGLADLLRGKIDPGEILRRCKPPRELAAMAPSDLPVSIVIINHNYEAYLATAIESALSQTTPAHEVIVVDDGSTDASVALIRSFGNRIRPVLKPAGGHVSATNAGYAVATGGIVMFLDADDVLYPGCVAAVLANWQPGDAKIQFRLDTIDPSGADQNMPFPYFAPDLTPEAVHAQACAFGCYPWTVSSGNAFSKTLLDRLMPIDDSVIYRSPDGYLSKMAPLFGDVRSMQAILGAYRVHGRNAWAQDRGGMRVEPIIRWLKFDIVLQRAFETIAAERGIQVKANGNFGATQHVEYRLLAHRFARAQSPYYNDRAVGIMRLGLVAALRSPNVNLRGRLIWCVWFLVVGFSPLPVVRWVFGVARTQNARLGLARFLVAIGRGAAKKERA